MKKVYGRPKSLRNVSMHYCPGCGHSIIHRLLAELIDEMKLREKAICVRTNNIVFSYQGDGDLAAIGTAEALHSANRGEFISVIFVNNAVYGMTGGQMAPTTLIGQKTTTSPFGRKAANDGYPINVSELLANLDGTSYIERVAVNTPANIKKTKKAIQKSFQHQQKKTGFSLVEILSACPTNWRMNPVQSCKWITDVMEKKYPLGVVKEVKC